MHSMNWLIVFFSLINLSVCIYEDQIGKFDWRQSYVGRIKFSGFDTVSTAKKIIVATEENVLAALHLKTGQIIWRHVLESGPAGSIQFLDVGEKVVTVTGTNPYLVRGWDSNSGVILWEWSLTLANEELAEFSSWWVHSHNMLVHMLPAFGSHLEVSMYNLKTGQNRGKTSKMPASWSNEGCIVTPPYYTCVSGPAGGQNIHALDVTTAQLISKPLEQFGTNGNIFALDGKTFLPSFIVDNNLVVIKDGDFQLVKAQIEPEASVTVTDTAQGPVAMQVWTDDVMGFSLTAHNVANGVAEADIRCLNRTLRIPEPTITGAVCASPSGTHHVCRILLVGDDDSLHLIQQNGRVVWTREEALASAVTAEFVDLPVSDLDAAIESEFDQKEGSVWAAFTRRLHTQYQQLMTFWETFPSLDDDQTTMELHRDYFNLHKIIVLLTDCGKVFGVDNLSGDILWQHYEDKLDTENAVMFSRRAARHAPLRATLTIVGKHEDTGNGLVVSLDPIKGTLIEERVLHLDAQLLQCTMLHTADNDKLHALILLDKDESVMVLPVSAAPLVENIYMYVADRSTAAVQGYALKYDGRNVVAERTWSLNLGGDPAAGHLIVSVAPKSPHERVHSAGRVLGDRSVLYKYTNPNLVLFVTEAPNKDMVVATCVDAVSGAVVYSQASRRARAARSAVHADNSLAYLYYSDKQRRHEIATMELYEGKQRWLPAGAAFSSLASDRAPSVERQTYILPATATAAAFTTTERGLTDRHVLLALSTGAIVELPWAFLEPRRPLTPSTEEREEGLIPYAPELPLPAEAVINYNMTLQRISAIYTAPSGLESTSLVLATGLDLFYTRVAPSKTFDLLKEDFDYYLIAIVLAALLVATYSTRHFASKKILKMAWK